LKFCPTIVGILAGMRLLLGAAVGTTALALAAVPALAATMVDATVTNNTTVTDPASVPLSNGSFEDTTGAYVDGGLGFMPNVTGTTIPGWTVVSGNVDWEGSYWQAADGSYSVDLNGDQPGAISTRFSTTAGATYYVQFSVSGNPAGGPDDKTGTVQATGGDLQGFDYNTASAGNTLNTSDSTGDMMWAAEGYSFTATDSSTTLTFASTTPADASGSTWYGPALDNVTVTRILGSGSDCKRGGWTMYQALSADNTLISFKNQGQCVSHFARSGDVPIGSPKSDPKPSPTATPTQGPGAQCKNGGWVNLPVTDSQGNPVLDSQGNPATFRNQGQCVSFFARGGDSLTGLQSHAPKQKAPKQKNGKD
jgi:choice-of-anchor C domain-containing protein